MLFVAPVLIATELVCCAVVSSGSESLTSAVQDEIRAVCRELLASAECPRTVHQRLTTIAVGVLYTDRSRPGRGLLLCCPLPSPPPFCTQVISFTRVSSPERRRLCPDSTRMSSATVVHTGGNRQYRSRARCDNNDIIYQHSLVLIQGVQTSAV